MMSVDQVPGQGLPWLSGTLCRAAEFIPAPWLCSEERNPLAQKDFQVIAHYHVQPEHRATVLELLARLRAASREEPANLSYDYFQNVDDSAHLVILERYTDAEGFAAHRESEHFRVLGIDGIIPRLDRRQVDTYPVVTG
ncbi:putative quinol monooxygenase [Nocardia lijiangensis]|uniref:putative quinol monooxygenase n=1 Tax=Nocardia lijiangensis TaxID=299618 RepID=UPI003D76353D